MQVDVNRHNGIGIAQIKRGSHGSLFAEITRELDQADPRIGRHQALDNLNGLILGAIIDKDDLDMLEDGGKLLLHHLNEGRNGLFFVVHRHNQGHLVTVSTHNASPKIKIS